MIYTLEELQQECRKGNRHSLLLFYGHTQPPGGAVNQGCLSQWWMRPFTVDGVTYSCAEQYMMAGKARLFNDEKALSAIMSARDPRTMKRHGRSVRDFKDSVWEEHRQRIVMEANRAKFGQNPDLLAFLLGTKGRILAEASPSDRIWGIGMAKGDPGADDPLRWRGKNLLGFALTEVRDELMKEGARDQG
ncbi:MAG: NADAR family protein [Methanomassiliicoccaceae archaeon]|nr:NADAR family protein [Methanomassiliicoccaceae archaeon]